MEKKLFSKSTIQLYILTRNKNFSLLLVWMLLNSLIGVCSNTQCGHILIVIVAFQYRKLSPPHEFKNNHQTYPGCPAGAAQSLSLGQKGRGIIYQGNKIIFELWQISDNVRCILCIARNHLDIVSSICAYVFILNYCSESALIRCCPLPCFYVHCAYVLTCLHDS